MTDFEKKLDELLDAYREGAYEWVTQQARDIADDGDFAQYQGEEYNLRQEIEDVIDVMRAFLLATDKEAQADETHPLEPPLAATLSLREAMRDAAGKGRRQQSQAFLRRQAVRIRKAEVERRKSGNAG